MTHVRKLRLDNRMIRRTHYSGWHYAVQQLEPLCAEDGIHVDTFLEWTFAVELAESLRTRLIPYQKPWIGFFHNPPGIPEWHEYWSSPQVLLSHPLMRDSLRSCKGLLTLSRTMAAWLASRVDVPVLALVHPTTAPKSTFSMDRFLAARERRVIQVGWWLRRLTSIAQLPVSSLQRAILHPLPDDQLGPFQEAIDREVLSGGAPAELVRGIARIPYQTNQGYDELLSSSIVFVDLYDAVANNTVIECVMRNTPILVNPLPSVVEYLGSDYPLYFNSLSEAGRKADDLGCIGAACQYLQELSKEGFSGESFREALARSSLYHAL